MKVKKSTMSKFLVLSVVIGLIILMTAHNALAIALPGRPALSQAGLFEAEAYRGKVVYLDFWASWCKPCKQSFPWMQKMHEKYESMGLKVVAVNLDKDKALANKFLNKNPGAFTIKFDPSGDLAEQYQLIGMPMTYIIDRQGIIRYRHIGYVPAMQSHYEKQILEMLKK